MPYIVVEIDKDTNEKYQELLKQGCPMHIDGFVSDCLDNFLELAEKDFEEETNAKQKVLEEHLASINKRISDREINKMLKKDIEDKFDKTFKAQTLTKSP